MSDERGELIIRLREERDHYRRLVLEEHPKDTAKAIEEFARYKEYAEQQKLQLAEERAIVKWTCPLCREPWDGEGAWRCRDCDIDNIGVQTVPPRIPLAQLERNDLRAALKIATEALKEVSLDAANLAMVLKLSGHVVECSIGLAIANDVDTALAAIAALNPEAGE